jgi:WD40 repeat protein/tetratricopeptide (TPR) repeat protein
MATPPRNPYVAGRAISSARGFWGRADVFRVVQEELSHPDRNAVVLFGQRRIGKTSILLNLRSRLPSPPFVSVYFDLMDRARQPLNEVLFEIARAIAQELNMAPPARADFERDPTTFRQHFLASVYDVLGAGRRLMLLFDEFDVLDLQQEHLPENSAARAFFPYLRETMTREPRLGFVVVVGRKSGELSTDFKSTFKAARYVRVSVLDDFDARELILTAQRDGSLRYGDRAIERILSLTAGHPYFTQLMCQLVFERAYSMHDAQAGAPAVTVEGVDATVPQALEAGENIFEWIWDGLPPAERVIFSAIASNTAEGAVVTEERLLATLQDSGVRILVRELELAPRTLIEWGMLKEVSGGYAFFIELMRRWVATRKPMNKVKDELDRINPLADTLFQGANGYYRRGDYDDAIPQLRQALSVNPNHLKARLLLGEVYREQGKLDDMVRELAEAYRIDPDAGRVVYENALLLRAEASERADQQQAAIKDYERVLEISPNNRTAQQRSAAIATEQLEQKADEFLQAGRWADAATTFQQLLAFDANNARWRDGLERVSREQTTAQRYADGQQAMRRQDWGAAQRAFADVVYAQPDYSESGQMSAATLLAEATQRTRAAQPARQPITTASPPTTSVASTSLSTSEGLMKRIVPAVLAVVVLAVLGFVVLPRILQPQTAATPPAATSAIEPDATGPAATTTTSEAGTIRSSIEPERVINVDAGITDVAYSPGGLLIAAAAPDQKVKLWNAADGALVRELEQTQAPESVAFSPDGTRIAVSQINGAVQLFNVEDGSVAVTLRDLPTGVKSRSVAINGDGTLVAAGYDDGKVRVWRVGDGELVTTFAGHNDRVAQVAFGPLDQSSPLASASTNGVQIWGFDGGTEPKQRLDVDSPTVAIRPDGLAIATGGSTATVWTRSDSQRNDLPSESPVTAVAYSAKGDFGAWADAGVHLTIVDQTGTVVQRIDNAHARPITRIAFRDDGAQVATASQDGTVKLWLVNPLSSASVTLTKQNELNRQGPIRAVAFSPNGTLIAIGTGSDAGSLWRPDLNKNAYLNPTGASFDVIFSADGKSLKVGDSSNVAMYDVSASTLEDGTANAPLILICEGVSDHITAIAYDQDSRTLVASSEDGSLHVWDATDCADKTPSNFKQEVIGGQTLRDVAFMDGGARIVAGGSGQTNVWSVTGTPIANTLDQPFALAVDSNSDVLALATDALILRDHDLDEIRRAGGDGEVHALAFSKDGSMLAAGYADGKVRIWRPGDLTLLDQIVAHEGKVTSLAFSPDGTQLVSGGDDKIAKLWRVEK